MSNNNWIIPAAGAGLIGLFFVGFQTQEQFSTENVANLPGVITRVDELSNSVDRRFEALQSQVDRRLNLEIRSQIHQLREDIKSDIQDLHEDIDNLRENKK